jgi:signal transduction histidine kinase
MADLASSGSRVTGSNRAAYWMSFPIIAFVALRKVIASQDSLDLITALGLLGLYLLLLTTMGSIHRRFRGYLPFYLVLQSGIVLALGLMRPYEDTWALLYIPLGFQLVRECSHRVALTWGALLAVSLLTTLIFTFGWIPGLGYGLFYIAGGIFFVAYDVQYAGSEVARRESQDLLAELQQAHNKLKDYASQAEDLAAAQEHEHIAHELHDSVSQIIFGITLDAQSARLLLDKEPSRVPLLLDRLQEQTASALAHMRALISQWRAS